jgi:excisionase family DNA binding protein
MSGVNHYEDVFSIDEVARILKISKRYLFKLIKEGKLGAMKIGREYRIPKSVVDSYFSQASAGPSPAREYGFGTWADRADVIEDSVDYVNRIRAECEKSSLSEIVADAEKELGRTTSLTQIY